MRSNYQLNKEKKSKDKVKNLKKNELDKVKNLKKNELEKDIIKEINPNNYCDSIFIEAFL